MDQFGLVQPIDFFGQGVVVAVTTTADRGFYTCLGETLGVQDGDILGEFNQSSQRIRDTAMINALALLPQVSSTRELFAVGC